MKKTLFRLFIVIASLILIASAGYRYKISKDAIHRAVKMRNYLFIEENEIESKTNGFLRALKKRKFKLAANFLLDGKNINSCKYIFDRNSKYFFNIEKIEVLKNIANVDLKIYKRVEKGTNRGFVKEDFCKIIFTFSKNQWKITNITDFVKKMKDNKEKILRKPLYDHNKGEKK